MGALASGEPADPNDILEAMDDANDMLDQWCLEDLMLYYDKVDIIPLIAGTITYDIGPTATSLVTDRPIEVLLANYRNANGLDSPVSIVANDSYERLVQKDTQQTLPSIMTYIPTNPNGTIRVWPTPSSGLSLRIMSNKQLTNIADLADDVPMPKGYNEAFIFGIAERLCIRHGRKEMLEEIKEKATNAKLNVKRKNKKKNVMFFDPALVSGRVAGTYNPYTDT